MRYMESEQDLDRPAKSSAFADRTTSCDHCDSALVVRLWSWNRLVRLRLLCSVLVAMQVTVTIAMVVQFIQMWEGPSGDLPFLQLVIVLLSIPTLLAWPAIAFRYRGVKLLNPGKLDPAQRGGPTTPVAHAVK
jgi:hypothetical protein